MSAASVSSQAPERPGALVTRIPQSTGLPANVADELCSARSSDPCAWLGMHDAPTGGQIVRVMRPSGVKVEVIAQDSTGASSPVKVLGVLAEVRAGSGLFEGLLSDLDHACAYRLRVQDTQGVTHIEEDPYRFDSMHVSHAADLEQFSAGEHDAAQDFLGAHVTRLQNVSGVRFAVWAPNAARVSVVGDFNFWDARRHMLRLHPRHGVWELFVPGAEAGQRYKFDVLTHAGDSLLKADPFARRSEEPPANASVIESPRAFGRGPFQRDAENQRNAAISIYEVHLGSWRRAEDNRYLNWDELGEALIPYAQSLNFTHLQLMPVAEYPFAGSWGYQPVSLFAPTSRFGDGAGFRRFVERAHLSGLGVLLDWVPAHFPNDAHGLAAFDGTCLYEHADPQRREHPDWGTLIYNYGRNEVRSFLRSSARHWLDHYSLDGLRVDAVASMLYHDYSRKEGEWLPNVFGGRENLEAVDFLRELNTVAYRDRPGTMMVAEESTAWDGVTRPAEYGGLGFGYKWNMGWMNDTLAYFGHDPIHRSHHHDSLTFSMVYAFAENFVLPLSHDEVVHGKGSLLSRMPGDRWQQFANLRGCYGYMWGHPGKKLLFMGGEFAQEQEWNHQQSLDWHLLASHEHRGVSRLIADLNALLRSTPALHAHDSEPEHFQWLDVDNAADSVIAFTRSAADGSRVVVACNFTPVVREAYRVGVPKTGFYAERLNTDSGRYGGSNVGNSGGVASETVAINGFAQSIEIRLPPLATIVFSVDA